MSGEPACIRHWRSSAWESVIQRYRIRERGRIALAVSHPATCDLLPKLVRLHSTCFCSLGSFHTRQEIKGFSFLASLGPSVSAKTAWRIIWIKTHLEKHVQSDSHSGRRKQKFLLQLLLTAA